MPVFWHKVNRGGHMKKSNNGFFARQRSGGEHAEADDKTMQDVKKYSSMSREELVDELFAQAAAARRRGELNDEKLAAFYNAVNGMLNDAQRAKLDILMRALSEH